MTLQEILDAIAAGRDLSELLAGVDLSALDTEALAALDAVLPNAEDDADAFAAATAIDSLRTVIAEHQATASAAVAERTASLDAIRARRTPTPAEAAPAVEPVVETAPVEAPPVAEPIAAAAGAPRVNIAAIAARTARPAPPVATEPPALGYGDFVIAAADVPGFGAGQPIQSHSELGRVMYERLRTLPENKVNIAVIRKAPRGALVAATSKELTQELVDRACDQSRLPGGSLLAAGGWCAPSETWYDICPTNIATDLFTVPEVQVERGGVRFTKGIDICAASTAGTNAATGFRYTEAQMISGVTKPCLTIPCPAFSEVRLDIEGICIKSDIPLNRAYPEVVAEFAATVMALHRLEVQQSRYAKALAAAVDFGTQGSAAVGTSASILDAAEFVAMNVRTSHLRAYDETVEMVLPAWVLGAVRSDLAKRNAYDSPFDVSDAAIQSWFTTRHIAVQWLSALFGGGTAAPFVDPCEMIASPFIAPPATGWPTSVQGLAYLPGTFVAITENVINLQGVYDAASLANNQFTRLFTEDGDNLINKCYNAAKFSVPICGNGATGAQATFSCPQD